MLSSAFHRCLRSRIFYTSFSISKISINYLSSTSSELQNSNIEAPLINNLITAYHFSESEAKSVSKHLRDLKDPDSPIRAIEFLQKCELSESQIRKYVKVCPQILVLNVDADLKPKINFLQDLGVSGSDLAELISTNTKLLRVSLDRKLIPCIAKLRRAFGDDKDVINVLFKCKSIFTKGAKNRFFSNLKFLENCGVVGKQLSLLVKLQPCLLSMRDSALQDTVQRVREMGIPPESKMFKHALKAMASMKTDTLEKKLDLFKNFGFSEQETSTMFIKAPIVFSTSEEKLRTALFLFLETVKIDRSVLVSNPVVLIYNVEKRILPRCKVVSALKSKSMWKNDRSLGSVIILPEEKFLQKYILRFKDEAEELLRIYEGNVPINVSTG